MTAFASAEADTGDGELAIELRSVNHRYLEPSLRLPDELRALEPALRERLAARLARGKVDLSLRWKPAAGAATLEVDAAAIERLSALAREFEGRFPGLQVEFTQLLAWPGVLRGQQVDMEALHAAALRLLATALDELVAARAREGGRLGGFLLERLARIEAIVETQIRPRLPELRVALRARLEARVAELAQAPDPGRLEQELVIQLQRLDVDEELDRLHAHIAEARRVLALDEPVGRRLDFLMQEFNREANTLGSKAVDTATSAAAVELKVLIEQMREQVQNLE